MTGASRRHKQGEITRRPYRLISAHSTELTAALWRIMTAPDWAEALKIYTPRPGPGPPPVLVSQQDSGFVRLCPAGR